MISCLDKFAEDARRDPDRQLYDFLDCEKEPYGHQILTNMDTWKWANAVASELKEKGAKHGDRAIIICMQDAGTVCAVWGCMIAGVVFTVLPPPIDQSKIDRFISVIKSCKPRFLISNEALEKTSENDVSGQLLRKAFLDVVSLKRIYTDKVQFKRFEEVYPWQEDETVYLQYTSGSTSAPKGVMIKYGNLSNCIQLCLDEFDFRIGDHNLGSWVPFYHNLGLVLGVFIPIIAPHGISYFIPTLQFLADPRIWIKVLSDYKINATAAPNSAYEVCTRLISAEDARQYDLHHVTHLINGSEFVDNKTIQKFCKLFDISPNCFSPGYGLSECVCVATVSCQDYTVQTIDPELYAKGRFVPTDGDGKEIVSIGKPANGLIAVIAHGDGTPCESDEIGEIFIQGPNVCSGYFQNEEETKRFQAQLQGYDGYFYRTGDMGIVYDGQLYMTGRLKEMVVVHGKNIFPSDVVLTLNKAGVALPMDAMTIFSVLRDGIEDPVFLSEAEEGADYKQLALDVNHVTAEFLEFSFSDIVFVRKGTLPRTDNRKIRSIETKRLYQEGGLQTLYSMAGAGDVSEAVRLKIGPASSLEDVQAYVIQVVRHLLPGRDFGIDDSFIGLGADSLGLVTMAGEIENELGISVDLRNVAANPTVRSLSTLVYKALRGEPYTEAIDLKAECVLPEGFRVPEGEADLTKAKKIFLTGATGFLGAYLIDALIAQRKDVTLYCHVRAADKESGMQRIVENLKKYNLWQEELAGHIVPVTGDLQKENLGIGEEEYAFLSTEADTVIHNGALLNFMLPYASLKSINVTATQKALKLAAEGKKKAFVYVSSYSAYDTPSHFDQDVYEDDPMTSCEGFFLGYSESKWVSEKIVKQAQELGLPTIIIRPGDITGTVKDGIWKVEDLISRSLVGCIQMKAVPDINVQMHLTPVDYVAQSIAAISFRNESVGHAFNILNEQLLPVKDITRYVRTKGYVLKTLPYKEWCALLESKTTEENILRVLSFLFTDPRFSGEGLSERFGAHQPRFHTENTRAALEGTGISCPPMDRKMIDSYLRYFASLGYFAQPGLTDRILSLFIR